MKIETRLTRLEERYNTLYQRSYAIGVRREGLASRWVSAQEARLKRWDKKLAGLDQTALKRLGWILRRLKSDRGLHLVMLDHRELQLLKNHLARKYKVV